MTETPDHANIVALAVNSLKAIQCLCWAIEEAGYKDDVTVAEYTLWLFDKIKKEEPPLRIVFDRNIDQWYEPSKVWAVQNNYKYVLVRIDVSRQLPEKRLQTREAGQTAHVFSVLDSYEDQHRKLSKAIDADITLENDYDLDLAAKRIARSAASLDD